jgi:hypothetical protein
MLEQITNLIVAEHSGDLLSNGLQGQLTIVNECGNDIGIGYDETSLRNVANGGAVELNFLPGKELQVQVNGRYVPNNAPIGVLAIFRNKRFSDANLTQMLRSIPAGQKPVFSVDANGQLVSVGL